MSLIPRNHLNRIQNYQLMQLISAEFPSQGVSDDNFAIYASTKLGFTVNGRNVHGARNDLGIPPAVRKASTIAERLEELENRIAKLEKEWQS